MNSKEKEAFRIKKAHRRQAIKNEKKAFSEWLKGNTEEINSDAKDLVKVKEPRETNDIVASVAMLALVIAIVVAIVHNEKFTIQIPLIFIWMMGFSCVELFVMILHLNFTNWYYKKYKDNIKKRKLLTYFADTNFYSFKITGFLLKVSFIPLLIFNFIIRSLGLDSVKNHFSTYAVAVSVPLLPAFLISIWITGFMTEKNVLQKGQPAICFAFIIMLILIFAMIYFIARFSFYIINCDEYLNDREQKNKEFRKFWTQMRIVIYFIYLIFSFAGKILDSSFVLTTFIGALSFVMILDTFVSKCKEQKKE